MGMDQHVNNITRSCFCQLRQLQSIRRSLTTEAVKTLVHSPHIKSRRLLLQYFLRGHKRCHEKTAICAQPSGQADLEQKESRSHHPSAHAGISSTGFLFVNVSISRSQSLCVIPFTVVARHSTSAAHLRSAMHGDLTVPRTRTHRFGPRSFHISHFWTGCVELAAQGHSYPETVAEMLQKHVVRHTPSGAYSAYV